jgi:adenylate kinase
LYERELAAFADALHELHVDRGAPAYRQIQVSAKAAGRLSLSSSAISEVLGGKRLPSMEFTLELVRQLVGDDRGAREQWRERWKQVKVHQRRASAARKSGQRLETPELDPSTQAIEQSAEGNGHPRPRVERTATDAHLEATQTLEAAHSEANAILESAREQADEILRAANAVLRQAKFESQVIAATNYLRTRKSLRIALVGPPAGGKGTQSAFLSHQLGVPSVHLGTLFRQHILEGSDLGIAAKGFLDAGKLIPDEVTIAMVSGRLADADVDRGFLLDGVPRNLIQAEMIDELLALKAQKIDVALDIEIPKEEAFKRIVGRRICTRDVFHVAHAHFAPPKRYGVCDVCGGDLALRENDQRKAIEARWNFWDESSRPVIQKYETEGRIAIMSGLGRLQDVTAHAIVALAERLR